MNKLEQAKVSKDAEELAEIAKDRYWKVSHKEFQQAQPTEFIIQNYLESFNQNPTKTLINRESTNELMTQALKKTFCAEILNKLRRIDRIAIFLIGTTKSRRHRSWQLF